LKFYSCEELSGAEVYDSLGLLYGYVCGIDYGGEEPLVRVCVKFRAEDLMPDTAKLAEVLKSKGVEVRGEPLEVLVTLARKHGLDIPYRAVEKSIEVVKGFVKPGEIALIDSVPEGLRKRVVVLLNNPREARYRGRSTEAVKPPAKPEYVVGKLVVSLREGVVGYATAIVIGPGEPGLRVKRPLSSGYIAWLKYASDVKAARPDLYEKIARIRDPLVHRRVSLSEYESLAEVLKRSGVPEEYVSMLEKYVEAEEGQELYTDIPWSRVKVANDIVIVE